MAQIKKEKHSDSANAAAPIQTSKTLLAIKVVVPLMILMASFAGFLYLQSSKAPPRKPRLVETVWPVKVIHAKAQDVTPTLKLYGKTVSRRQVELRSLVAGKIIKTGQGLKEGAHVKKGEMLVTIDDFDFKGAVREAKAFLQEAIAHEAELRASVALENANLKFAQAQHILAKKDYERAAKLTKRGTVTQKVADDRKVTLSQRAQTVASHKVNLDLHHARLKGQAATVERLKWKVDQAERRLLETKLIAPFDAYVSSVSAEIGRTVSANDSIAKLIDTNEIDVRFTLTDAQYGRILAHEKTLMDRKVAINWNVGEQPLKFTATIKRIGAQISSQTGGVEVYAAIDTPTKQIALRTGAFVEINVNDREYKNVYRLPQTAIYNSNTIYLVVNGRLQPQTVTIVGTATNDSLVRADIPFNSIILSSRLTLAGEGVKVKFSAGEDGLKPDQPKKKLLKENSQAAKVEGL